jgi:HlyD family secretion protein
MSLALATDPGAELRPCTDLARPRRALLLASFLLVGALGGWAALTPITSAVIAGGQVVVSGHPRAVQSLEGGVIAAIRVKTGDTVAAGQVLVELDKTLLATNLGIARTRLAAALALQARLSSEQRGLAAPEFSYPALPFPLPDMAEAEAAQRAIFAARAEVRAGEAARNVEAVAQIDAQIAGTEGQLEAIETRRKLAEAELARLARLAEEGLVRKGDLTAAESTLASLAGEAARLSGERAGLTTARRDAELAGAQAQKAALEEIVTDLREATDQVEELTLEIVTRASALAQVEIRAPVAGIVHDLQLTTVGGVLAPGATAMQIVPLAEGMDFEIRVDPRAIDQVWPGQPAELAFSAFDPQSAPKLKAQVAAVPADALRDPQTGASYYRVVLHLEPGELARLNGQEIRPGMPVEAYLSTGSHSVLDYLLSPVTAHLNRAFRE